MTKQILTSLCAVGLLLCISEGPASAASLADCGSIDIEADAQCKVMAEGGCTIDDCTPLVCSASLYAKCKGECQTPQVDCQASCKGTCAADCTASGGSIDCSANCTGRCNASCDGDCSGQCSSNANKSECEAKCKGTCEASCKGECQAKCEVVKPEATCEAKCEGSCNGSCTVKGSLGCHMDCSARGEASCTGGCEVACTQPDAAIFCNGQYVDHGGHAASCRSALEAAITATIEYDAHSSGSAECSGGSCKAEGEAEAKASCAMTSPGSNPGNWFGLGLFGAVATGLVLRRRERRGC